MRDDFGRGMMQRPPRTASSQRATVRGRHVRPHSSPAPQPQNKKPALRDARTLFRAAKKADMLRQMAAREQNQKNKKDHKRAAAGWPRVKKIVSYVALAAVMIGAGYVIIDSWITNQKVQQQLEENKHVVLAAQRSDATPEDKQKAEGKDETSRDEMIDSYRVEASLPRVIDIKSINVHARVLPMYVNPDNSVQAPINIFDAGWYTGSVKPGEKGAAVVVGHASGPTREGEFAYLDTLKPGSGITIERGDGTKLDYEVTEVKEMPLAQVDMNEMLRPHGTDEGLNLMTCSGKWITVGDKKTFDHRVMVFAKRVK